MLKALGGENMINKGEADRIEEKLMISLLDGAAKIRKGA
jgi:hypothetical protein